jgi:SAM-dependent methyltransferase
VRRGAVYDEIGHGYARSRRPDPRIEARLHEALGAARTVVNVGAGTGSYEPRDRWMLAVEPSAIMRAQRPPGLPPAIAATAEELPLDDGAVDAAMAVLTIQHWGDVRAGLRELRRVACDRVAVLTYDAAVADELWLLQRYVPEVSADDRRRFPPIAEIAGVLGGAAVETVRIPADCTDGFFHAFQCRPEAYLDPAVRAAQSAWSRLPDGVEERALAELARDLESGAWDERYGEWRRLSDYDGGLRLVVSERRDARGRQGAAV